jgi:hypothetical protein
MDISQVRLFYVSLLSVPNKVRFEKLLLMCCQETLF